MNVQDLKNIGPTSAQWLHEAGIHTRADLEAIGAVMAYKVLHHQRPQQVTVMLLYALEGALRDVSWNVLSPERKTQLKRDAREPLQVM